MIPTVAATLEPMAANVNGEGILLADFEAEVGRVRSAMVETGSPVGEDQINDLAIQEMIDQVLSSQTARKNGYQLSDVELDQHISDLAQGMGGMEALNAWQTENGYTSESFRRWLRIGTEAAWQQNQWLAGMPTSSDQVHARQIFLKEEGEATSAYQQLEAGADFLELALEYDPLTGGDLAWLIPGVVLYPELDDAIFKLNVGDHSPIIKTEIGYHILYVEAKESDRVLTPSMQDQKRDEVIGGQLEALRAESAIEILIDQ